MTHSWLIIVTNIVLGNMSGYFQIWVFSSILLGRLKHNFKDFPFFSFLLRNRHSNIENTISGLYCCIISIFSRLFRFCCSAPTKFNHPTHNTKITAHKITQLGDYPLLECKKKNQMKKEKHTLKSYLPLKRATCVRVDAMVANPKP